MADNSVVLVNTLKVDPTRQKELISMLEHNIETVIRSLDGWRGSRLIASKDGTGVVIYSEWETPAAVQAMRSDARMVAYFPKIRELANFESTVGELVFERGC
ncbi:antibiotic biosynthesis monooxygenase [Rhizobium sp. S96]|uniref:putative quinol monooxygenase n=1 Tax=Rhizobium sp. S96 TaxID=3055140 RepID=UPI0025AAA534|nr:antibiotic biosynthesis monooxygenase [Rhizobium sp. S96]MDM9622679.1 antibiotic biosynthesis monooxygenase [Rhizobium sp. S96]